MPSVDLEYNKKYYENNKEKFKEYFSQKIKCEECGAVFTRSNLTNHKKTKKHKNASENLVIKYNKLKEELNALKNKKIK